jgi:hypothetical protein
MLASALEHDVDDGTARLKLGLGACAGFFRQSVGVVEYPSRALGC